MQPTPIDWDKCLVWFGCVEYAYICLYKNCGPAIIFLGDQRKLIPKKFHPPRPLVFLEDFLNVLLFCIEQKQIFCLTLSYLCLSRQQSWHLFFICRSHACPYLSSQTRLLIPFLDISSHIIVGKSHSQAYILSKFNTFHRQ